MEVICYIHGDEKRGHKFCVEVGIYHSYYGDGGIAGGVGAKTGWEVESMGAGRWTG
jgi:hypothetical protein